MKWTFAVSALSLVACSDAPRATLMDLPPAPMDMAMPADLSLDSLTIATVTPSTVSSVGRDTITIAGTGFDTRTSFLVGGQPAEVMSVSATQAVIYAPASTVPFGSPVTIQALRSLDGARAANSNAMGSASRFSYYASAFNFQQTNRFNPININGNFYNSMRLPVVGDFNGDKLPDLFISSINDAAHTVLLNAGGGNFTITETANNGPGGPGANKGFTADINGDTFLDVVLADQNSTWSYFMGNGQGLFNTGAGTPTNSYAQCNGTTGGPSPVPMRLSSATSFDIVTACQANGNVRIWQSPGGAATNAFYGTQNTGSQGPTPGISGAVHLQVVDVNKDTYNDLVVLSNTNNQPTLTWYNSPAAAPPVVLPTTATGTSGAAGTTGANQLNQNPFWMKCVDLNNDMYPDCVVADLNTATIRVFMNNAGAFVGPTANGVISVGQQPREVNVADMNGDGKLDLLVANGLLNGFDIIPGRGDGTFGAIVAADGRTLAARTTTTVPDCLRTWGLQVADFDRDGLPDVVTTCEANAANNAVIGGVMIFKNVSR